MFLHDKLLCCVYVIIHFVYVIKQDKGAVNIYKDDIVTDICRKKTNNRFTWFLFRACRFYSVQIKNYNQTKLQL